MHLGIKLAPTQKVTAKLTDKYFFNKFISQIYFLKNKHFSFISVFNMQMNKQSETMDVSNHETIVDCIYCWIMLLFGWCKIATCNLFVSKYLPVKVTDKFWNLPAWFEKYPYLTGNRILLYSLNALFCATWTLTMFCVHTFQ